MTIHHPPAGLDGVAAAVTALSHVDGERGELIVAGQTIGDLAHAVDFETLTARLWATATGETSDDGDVRAQFGRARVAAFEALPGTLAATRGRQPVEALRVGVAALRPVAGLQDAATIVGGMPVVAAALIRQSQGKAPVAPDASLCQAADLLRMIRGEAAPAEAVQALDTYLVTVADHGMNASTFAARVVASTQADLFMAVTAAYCALTGPLHGGAPEPVLDMLDAIGTADRIRPWIDEALARGERLMGFGHRIYKVLDPRADVLRAAVLRLTGGRTDLGLAAQVEAYAREALQAAKPGRRLDTNVEFYTAILLDALAIPRSAFTPIFAVARAAGWTAHALEQQRTGRLLRPSATYVGVMPQDG